MQKQILEEWKEEEQREEKKESIDGREGQVEV